MELTILREEAEAATKALKVTWVINKPAEILKTGEEADPKLQQYLENKKIGHRITDPFQCRIMPPTRVSAFATCNSIVYQTLKKN